MAFLDCRLLTSYYGQFQRHGIAKTRGTGSYNPPPRPRPRPRYRPRHRLTAPPRETRYKSFNS